MRRVCGSCAFWVIKERTPGGMTTGQCRRYPPEAADATGKGRWPLTIGDEWCGEFYAREKDEPKDG